MSETTHEFQVNGLTPGATYTYRVRSVDSAGNNSAWSSWNSFVAPLAPVPAPVPISTAGGYLTTSHWHWDPIPVNPVIDPNSSALVNTLLNAAGNTGKVIAVYSYGVPCWEIPKGTSAPAYAVKTTVYNVRTVQGVRIPDAAAPQPGSPSTGDGAMVIFDWDAGKIYEFYEAWKNGLTWQASDMTVFPMAGTGSGDGDIKVGQVGAGVSRAAGIIRCAELESAWPDGLIPHALVFSTNVAAKGVYRYPAVKTDGLNLASGANPLPEGSRIQLDPAFNVNTSTLSDIEKVVARTLQVYGAYCIDNGGARIAFNLEGSDVQSSTYRPPIDPGNAAGTNGWARAYGITANSQSLAGIPWSRCRVLKNWNGAA